MPTPLPGVLDKVMEVIRAPDLAYQTLRRITRVFRDGRPDHRTQRQMPVVDVDQVEHIARLPPSRRRERLVGGDIGDMQAETKQLILDCGKAPEIPVARPFQTRG